MAAGSLNCGIFRRDKILVVGRLNQIITNDDIFQSPPVFLWFQDPRGEYCNLVRAATSVNLNSPDLFSPVRNLL